MPEFDNEMRGVLFKNDKQGNENRPDFRGTITVHGVEYQIASWVKQSKNPEVGKFHSIKVTAPDGSGRSVRRQPQESMSDDDDDIGF